MRQVQKMAQHVDAMKVPKKQGLFARLMGRSAEKTAPIPTYTVCNIVISVLVLLGYVLLHFVAMALHEGHAWGEAYGCSCCVEVLDVADVRASLYV